MAVHDTIGDFITVIRNAGSAGKSTCQYPHSNLRAVLQQFFVTDLLKRFLKPRQNLELKALKSI